MRFWGITGTNGKTTTAWILADFMNAGSITTVEVNTLKRQFYTGYTTPPLKQLKEIYAEMEEAHAQDCVMEVSSHAIHQNRVGFGETTIFSGGAFTNLSEDHLDYHKTMEEYFNVKLDFARRLAQTVKTRPDNSRKDFPPFVVCLDSAYGEKMLDEAGKLPLNVIPVSRARPRFDLSELRLMGDYNKSNVLVAATLAEAAGIKREVIQEKIPLLRPKWGRLERVENKNVEAEVYVDFAHTPDGLNNVLLTARGFTRGHLWVVFGAGGDRDAMKRPLMGEACEKNADFLVLTSDNPRSEDPQKIANDILEGISQKNKVIVELNRARAIELALKHARKGDVVIIAGKGHEQTQEICGKKTPFNDCEVVKNFSF